MRDCAWEMIWDCGMMSLVGGMKSGDVSLLVVRWVNAEMSFGGFWTVDFPLSRFRGILCGETGVGSRDWS